MSHFVFVVYSNALASAILLPSSFIVNRKNRRPLSLSLLCKFFLLSLIGSPTLGSAMSNLVPAFTFVLAVIFRMEKLDIRNSKSQMKILGTVVSISGALIVTLYKGASIGESPSHSPENPSQSLPLEQANNWVIGGLFLAIAGYLLQSGASLR